MLDIFIFLKFLPIFKTEILMNNNACNLVLWLGDYFVEGEFTFDENSFPDKAQNIIGILNAL